MVLYNMQALFEPLETVAELKSLISHLLQPGVAGWYLYTAPPKKAWIPPSLDGDTLRVQGSWPHARAQL